MAAIDYCTLADIEMYAGVDFSEGIGPSDSQITSMITNASRMVDAYAGRQLAGTETETEYFDIHYSLGHLSLAKRPVASITSISTVNATGNETLLVEGRIRSTDDYWIEDGEAGIIRFHHPWAESLRQYLKVVYTYGNTSAPIEAKMATILLVVRQCARASLNDENCTERMKEFWRPLLASSEKEYMEMLKRVQKMGLMGVATYGQYRTNHSNFY